MAPGLGFGRESAGDLGLLEGAGALTSMGKPSSEPGGPIGAGIAPDRSSKLSCWFFCKANRPLYFCWKRPAF